MKIDGAREKENNMGILIQVRYKKSELSHVLIIVIR